MKTDIIMLGNIWNNISQWFRDLSERRKLVRSFNEASREAFVLGIVPTLLQSSFSSGDRNFKHQYSHWLNSGFRIKAFQGKQLSKTELIQIGTVVMSDNTLIRKLFVLGFDTLEVCCDVGSYGCKWPIKDNLQLN